MTPTSTTVKNMDEKAIGHLIWQARQTVELSGIRQSTILIEQLANALEAQQALISELEASVQREQTLREGAESELRLQIRSADDAWDVIETDYWRNHYDDLEDKNRTLRLDLEAASEALSMTTKAREVLRPSVVSRIEEFGAVPLRHMIRAAHEALYSTPPVALNDRRLAELEAELEEESGRANDEHLNYMRSRRGELELAAAIEKVRVAANEEFTWQQFGSAVDRILATAPADLLREHDAQVWDKARAVIDGLHPRCTEECAMCAELDQWLTAFDDANPYQVKPDEH